MGRWGGKVATVSVRVMYTFQQKVGIVSDIDDINNDVATDCSDRERKITPGSCSERLPVGSGTGTGTGTGYGAGDCCIV